MQLALHGLFTPLYLGMEVHTKSSIEHEVLTARAYVVMLMFMSLVKTRL